jgi:asparagine synthase (glutamine-hydrolysing)
VLELVKKYLHKPVPRPSPLLEALAAEDRELIARLRGERLTYLSENNLASLATLCRDVEAQQLPGLCIEAGCALGGSAILLAMLKRPDRPMRVYDVFGMIPPPTREDTPDVHARYRAIAEGRSKGIDGDRYYGYEEDLLAVVQGNFRRFGIDRERHSVSLVKGLLQDTLHVDQPVALAHVDVDWYEPVLTCLERIFPRLVAGGSIVLDDYHDWGGCRKAADQYLAQAEDRVELDDSAGSLRITRLA